MSARFNWRSCNGSFPAIIYKIEQKCLWRERTLDVLRGPQDSQSLCPFLYRSSCIRSLSSHFFPPIVCVCGLLTRNAAVVFVRVSDALCKVTRIQVQQSLQKSVPLKTFFLFCFFFCFLNSFHGNLPPLLCHASHQ